MPGHEIQDQVRDLISLFVEREMAGVQQVNLRVGKVSLECRGTRRDERRIVGTPHDEGRRLALAKPCLPLGVGRDVGPIVVEQRRLDLALARLRKVRELVRPSIRM